MHNFEQSRKTAFNDEAMEGARSFTRSLHSLKKSLVSINGHTDVQKMWLRTDSKAEAAYDMLAYRMQTSNVAGQVDYAIKLGEAWLSGDHAAEKGYIRAWWVAGHMDGAVKAEKSLAVFGEAIAKAADAMAKLKEFRQYSGLADRRKDEEFRELVDDMFDAIPGAIKALNEATHKLDSVAYLGYQGKLRK